MVFFFAYGGEGTQPNLENLGRKNKCRKNKGIDANRIIYYYSSVFISIEVDVDRRRPRSKTTSIEVDVDITRFHKFELKVCFSESARKMMRNGGRVVVIGSIFVAVFNF